MTSGLMSVPLQSFYLINALRLSFCDDMKDNRGKKHIGNLFNDVGLNKIDKDYYKPIKTKSALIGNYIEYESKGDKDKNL